MVAAKSKPANGSAPKATAERSRPSPAVSGAATPVTKTAELDSAVPIKGLSKPDKVAYDAEQDTIKKEIDALQRKLSALQEKINALTQPGPSKERRAELQAELERLRQTQSDTRMNRTKVAENVKAMNETIQKKVKDLNAARGKLAFKSVEQVDARIQQLDKDIESGAMKLADEKRALQEISQIRRTRKVVQGFQADQEAIDKDREALQALRDQLDDPEAKAASEHVDKIRSELDQLKKDGDELYQNRNKLFDERNSIKAELDVLFQKKRDSAQAFRENNDRYWNKVNEDRARRAERQRQQRQTEEQEKKMEMAQTLREEASMPAFQAEIEDCQALIDHFSGKSSSSNESHAKSEVPKAETRQVDTTPREGMVVCKKKGEPEEDWFTAKSKPKANKKAPKPKDASSHNGNSSGQVNVPFARLSGLMALSIPPPSSAADVPRVVEDLKKKRDWYIANQSRITGENIAKAEAEIKRLLKGMSVADTSETTNGTEDHSEPTPVEPEASEEAVEQKPLEVDVEA